jgi:hypothetical protein
MSTILSFVKIGPVVGDKRADMTKIAGVLQSCVPNLFTEYNMRHTRYVILSWNAQTGLNV